MGLAGWVGVYLVAEVRPEPVEHQAQTNRTPNTPMAGTAIPLLVHSNQFCADVADAKTVGGWK